MIELSGLSLVWDGEWRQFVRLMDAYLAEICPPEERRQAMAGLQDAQLSARMIRCFCREKDPCEAMRIMDDGVCAGLMVYGYEEEQRCGRIHALFVLPGMRRRGLGRAACAMAEKKLRGLGAEQVRLQSVRGADGFWQRCGYEMDGREYCKRAPRRQHGPVQLLCYTRMPQSEEIYAPRLAFSVHLALVEPDLTCTPLLHNSGIVYARATQDERGVLHPYSLRRPWITRLTDGTWAVLARRVEAEGGYDPASEDHVLFFTSPDLLHYTEQPLLHISDPLAQEYLECTARGMQQTPMEGLVLPEGAHDCMLTDIPAETAQRLRTRFVTPVNVANEVPAEVTAQELPHVRALARYSDGSTVLKRVDWRLDGVDLSRPGCYPIRGLVHQDRFEFPFAWHKADPAICRWRGKYYFISTNDQDDNRTLFIREADSLPALATAAQVCILHADMYPHLGNLLWAPEMHVIRDRLYIFHAGTPGPFGQEQSHVMALKEGGDPLQSADWEMSRRVVRRDGSMLYGSEGITLDQTVFTTGGRLYTVWSQRQLHPVDQGAWLYIAELDADRPWQLKTDPMVLTVPEYGWENNHAFVVEGPFALHRGGRICLTYSAALVDSTYAVGMLSMPEGADPLDRQSWTKENCPLLTSRSVPGEYGPGHNAYVTDEDGLVWNAYHARPGVQGPRSSGIRRVHFNAEDFPVLDMTEEMDLKPELAWVTTTVAVP